MRRKECLNGIWYFVPLYDEFEPGSTLQIVEQDMEEIKVPSCWKMTYFDSFDSNQEASEHRIYNVFGYPDKWNKARAGIAGRKVHISRQETERVFLIFNGILQRGKVYINGVLAMETHEAFLPVRIDITSFLKDLDEEIEIQVWCGSALQVETQFGKKNIAPGGSNFAANSRGLWQDVFIEYIPNVYIEDFHIITSYRNKTIFIKTEIKSKSYKQEKLNVCAAVIVNESPVLQFESEPFLLQGGTEVQVNLQQHWESPRLWSPEDPFLYNLQIDLFHNDIRIDTIYTRFGFREVWAENYKFFLNGVRINLRGDAWHYQGLAMQTKEYAMNWYKTCMDVGINFVRLHAMPYPEFFLDAADETGMLIIDESAIYGSGKGYLADMPVFIENCLNHLRNFVKRDRNHPSVIIWSMQNEMRWIEGRDGYRAKTAELTRAMLELDDTRLISYDGDARLYSKEEMQVYSLHYNIDGLVKDWGKDKPLIFGEHGKWHYISPQVSSDIVGQTAYLSMESALYNLGVSERIFLEYVRKNDVTGICPFNFVNYMMYALPSKDIKVKWDDITTPGTKPEYIHNHCLTINNGLMTDQPVFIPNPSYFAIREGFKKAVVFADQYNCSFYGNSSVRRSFSVYNDTMCSRNVCIKYEIFDSAGTVIQRGEEAFWHTAGERREISFIFNTPHVQETEVYTLDIVLFHDGEEMYHLQKKYKIYPFWLKLSPLSCYRSRVAYAGPDGSYDIIKNLLPHIAWIHDITECVLEKYDVLIIGKNYSGHSRELQPVLSGFVKNGGTLIVLEQREFTLGEAILSGRRFFQAFINIKNHSIFNGLTDEDMGFWHEENIYDEKCKYIVENCFEKPANGPWRILMECAEGDFGWGGLNWSPMLEYMCGKGKIILNQLELIDNFHKVPQSCVILRNILEYADKRTIKKSCSVDVVPGCRSEFLSFFEKIGLSTNEDSEVRSPITLVDPYAIREQMILPLKKYVAEGGTLLIPNVAPEHENFIRLIAGKNVFIREHHLYQLSPAEHVLLEGISAFDLYKLEAVTYSPATKKNEIISRYSIEMEDAEVLLGTPRNPWKKYFVDGLGAEPIKIQIYTKLMKENFENRCHGVVAKYGKGRIIIPQVELLEDDKIMRFFTTLLSNLGADMRQDFLEYIKQETDFAIPEIMSLIYNGCYDYTKMLDYFSSSQYSLNNLGEGVYGWMTRIEKKDGFIHIPNSAGKKVFCTVFPDSDRNRNPMKRNEGELPDSSIVPDLIITSNCSFKLWVNGIFYSEYFNEGKMQKVKVQDILLDKGINRLFILCEGCADDIRINASFINKYGDRVEGLSYRLTLD